CRRSALRGSRIRPALRAEAARSLIRARPGHPPSRAVRPRRRRPRAARVAAPQRAKADTASAFDPDLPRVLVANPDHVVPAVDGLNDVAIRGEIRTLLERAASDDARRPVA